MTNEEAIKELIDASHREAKYGDTNNHYYEIMMRIEAFDMAIKALEQQTCEDCRNCKKWDECPCGKEGHEKGTSIGYSIGECKDYEPCEDYVSREAVMKCFKKWQPYMATKLWDYEQELKALPSVTPSIPDVENNYNIGYNCGYADAMIDIAEGSESE